MREQSVSYEFTSSGSCQDHIKIITCDHLVDKFLELIFVLSDLITCLLPCSRLLINLSQRKSRESIFHLILCNIKDRTHFYAPFFLSAILPAAYYIPGGYIFPMRLPSPAKISVNIFIVCSQF